MQLISKALLIACIALIPTMCPAQTRKVDSLKKELAMGADSAAKLSTLLALCNRKESLPGDSIYLYATRAKRIAGSLGGHQKSLLADYYILISKVTKGELDSTLDECTRTLRSLSYKGDKDLYVKYSLQKARIFIKSARYKEALRQLYTLLEESEQANDPKTRVYALTYIGWVHMEMEQLAQAISWFYKAENELNSSRPDFDYSPLYSNMAAVLDDMGKHDSAYYYVQLSVQYSQQYEDLSYLANAFAIRADIFVHKKNTDSAEASLNRAIAIRRLIGDPYYVLSDMAALANLYSTDNKPREGIQLCLEGIAMAKQFHFVPKQLYLSEALAENYKVAGDFKGYSATLKDIISLKDTLYQHNSHMALAEMQAKYESEKKENTIIEQKYTLAAKNNFIYGMVGLLVVSLIIGIAVFKTRKHRQTIKMKEAEVENNRKRILEIGQAREEERKRIMADLHDDLGSGLSSIRIMSDLIAGQSDQPEMVNKYAQKISHVSRDVAQGMNTIIWALIAENDGFHNLCEYIEQYGHSFFDKSGIRFHFGTPCELPDMQMKGAERKNIFLCIKEALHNVLKHSGAENVWVELDFRDSILHARVEDDGKGIFPQNKFGNGLRNMERRMQEIGGKITVSQGRGVLIGLEVELSRPSSPL